MRFRDISVSVIVSVTGLAAGCDKDIPKPMPSERSEVTVSLPPAAGLTRKPFDKLNADGS